MTTTMTGSRRAAVRTRLRLAPAQRIGLLVATVAAAAVALFVIVVRDLPGSGTAPLPWVFWVVAFAAAELLVVHVQLQRDAHSFSMTDLVLVLGLFLAAPQELVTAQVAGAGAALVLHRRQRGTKLLFNLAQYALGGGLAVTVFALASDGSGPRTWLAALAAVAVATLAADLSIFVAIGLSQGSVQTAELPRMLALSMPFTLGMAAVGVLAARTAATDPPALALLVLPAVLVMVAYRAWTRAREQQANLRVLHEVTSQLHQSGDPTAGLADFLASVRGAFRAEAVELVLLGGDGRDATVSSSGHDDGTRILAPLPDPVAARRLAASPGVTTARTTGRGDTPLDAYAADRGISDAMVAVLRTDERVHGLLLVRTRLGDVSRFSAADVALLETIAGHLATSVERGRLEEHLREVTHLQEQLRHQALHDSLTGLPNRALFLDRARQALAGAGRRGHAPVLLFLDLDGFKPVNDTHGHEAGDQLLQTVASRLAGCLRAGDTAARLGGDEFAVLLDGPVDEEQLTEVVERIRAAVTVPVDLGGGRLAAVSTSIGVAVGDDSIREADELVRRADAAMYLAKRGGGNAARLHGPDLDRAGADEDPAAELARAVRDGELTVVYQPLIDLRSGRPTGAEALVRWEHPDGLRTPESFIGLAEETGLIVDIGAQVLRSACVEAARWVAARPDAPGLLVTVNLSARQLAAPRVVDDVREALDAAGLAPHRLVLEITETVLMHDRETAAATLWSLKELGVRIAIDDFGTGYSSLAYLRRFPIDMLKVAGEFVGGLGRDAHDDVITRAIVDLADTLGLLTVAEGVETTAQHEFVTALQCDLAQGYLFARPLPAAAAHALITGAEGGPATAPARQLVPAG